VNDLDQLFGRNRLGAISAEFGINHVLTDVALDHSDNKTI
jgi:hypothetical protein